MRSSRLLGGLCCLCSLASAAAQPLDPVVQRLTLPLRNYLSRRESESEHPKGAPNFPRERRYLAAVFTHSELPFETVAPTLAAALLQPEYPMGAYFIIQGVEELQLALNEHNTRQRLSAWIFTIRKSCKRIMSAVSWLLRGKVDELLGLQAAADRFHADPAQYMRTLLQSEPPLQFRPQTLTEAVRFVGALATAELCLKLVHDLPSDWDPVALRQFRQLTLERVYKLELRLSLHEIQGVLGWLPMRSIPEVQEVTAQVEALLRLDETPAVAEYREIWRSLAAISKGRTAPLEPLQLLADCVLVGLLDGVKRSAEDAVTALRDRQKTLLFSDAVQTAFEDKYISQMFVGLAGLGQVLQHIAQSAHTALNELVLLQDSKAFSERLHVTACMRLQFERLNLPRLEQLAPKTADSLFWPELLSGLRETGQVLSVLSSGSPTVPEQGGVGADIVILRKTFSNFAQLERLLQSSGGQAALLGPSEALKEALRGLETSHCPGRPGLDESQRVTVEAVKNLFGLGNVNAQANFIPSDELASMAGSMVHSVQRFFPLARRENIDLVLNGIKTRFSLALFEGLGVLAHREKGTLLELVDAAQDILDLGTSQVRLTAQQETNFAKALGLMRSFLTTTKSWDARPVEMSVELATAVRSQLEQAKLVSETRLAAWGHAIQGNSSLTRYVDFWQDFSGKITGVFVLCEGFLTGELRAVEGVSGNEITDVSSLAQALLKLKDIFDKVGLCREASEKLLAAVTLVVDSLTHVVIVDYHVPQFFPSEADVKKAALVKKLVFY